MSVKRIIQESIEKNPLGVKEALEEALQERILVALEEKYKKMAMESDDEDEDDEDDEDDDEDDEDEDMDESFDLSDYTVEELEDFMVSEDFDQLDEISKKTLASYVKKAGGAGKEGLAHAVKSQMSAADSGDRAGYKKSQRQANNRSTGIQRAADRLAK